jgi:hypothetical protein
MENFHLIIDCSVYIKSMPRINYHLLKKSYLLRIRSNFIDIVWLVKNQSIFFNYPSIFWLNYFC